MIVYDDLIEYIENILLYAFSFLHVNPIHRNIIKKLERVEIRNWKLHDR